MQVFNALRSYGYSVSFCLSMAALPCSAQVMPPVHPPQPVTPPCGASCGIGEQFLLSIPASSQASPFTLDNTLFSTPSTPWKLRLTECNHSDQQCPPPHAGIWVSSDLHFYSSCGLDNVGIWLRPQPSCQADALVSSATVTAVVSVGSIQANALENVFEVIVRSDAATLGGGCAEITPHGLVGALDNCARSPTGPAIPGIYIGMRTGNQTTVYIPPLHPERMADLQGYSVGMEVRLVLSISGSAATLTAFNGTTPMATVSYSPVPGDTFDGPPPSRGYVVPRASNMCNAGGGFPLSVTLKSLDVSCP